MVFTGKTKGSWIWRLADCKCEIDSTVEKLHVKASNFKDQFKIPYTNQFSFAFRNCRWTVDWYTPLWNVKARLQRNWVFSHFPFLQPTKISAIYCLFVGVFHQGIKLKETKGLRQAGFILSFVLSFFQGISIILIMSLTKSNSTSTKKALFLNENLV